MFQIIAPISIKRDKVKVDVDTRDNTALVIEDYAYKLDETAELGLVKPGKKPYIGIQTKADDLSIGVIYGEILDVVTTEKGGVRMRVKADFGPYVTIFDRTHEKLQIGAFAVFVGQLSISTYKDKLQYTLFSRSFTVTQEAGDAPVEEDDNF